MQGTHGEMAEVIRGPEMSRKDMFLRFWSPWLTVPGLMVLALLLGTVWFLYTFEKEEYEYTRDLSPEALRNPLLAAEKYMRRVGHPSQGVKGSQIFLDMPSVSDAILIRYSPSGLGREMSENLDSWVKDGGHLLVLPDRVDSDHPEASGLLEKLGIQVKKATAECGCPDPSTKGAEDDSEREQQGSEDEQEELEDVVITDRVLELEIEGQDITLEYSGSPLLMDINDTAIYRIAGSHRRLYEEEKRGSWQGEPTARDESSGRQRVERYQEEKENWLLQYRLGNGKITVISDLSNFFNGTIGARDHAFFLSWLLKNDHKIWFLYTIKGESLVAELWKRAPTFWVIFFLFILLWLWRMQKQSGKILSFQGGAERNILAHIEATGNYYWRQGMSANIIEMNRRVLFTRWCRLYLGGGQTAENLPEVMDSFLKKGGSEEEFRITFTSQVNNEQELIRVSREMMNIQKQIQGGDKSGKQQ